MHEVLVSGYFWCRVNLEEPSTVNTPSRHQNQRETCLQQNPWLVDREARVEQRLGVLLIGTLSSVAAVLRSYGSV